MIRPFVLSPRGRAILLLYVHDMKLTGDDSVTIMLIKSRARYLSSLTRLSWLGGRTFSSWMVSQIK